VVLAYWAASTYLQYLHISWDINRCYMPFTVHKLERTLCTTPFTLMEMWWLTHQMRWLCKLHLHFMQMH
jgi:hypothetical protein